MPVMPRDSWRDFLDERPAHPRNTPLDVEHGYPTEILGWLVLVLNHHCPAIHGLTPEELISFGDVRGRVTRALHAVLGAEKEYVVQFVEAKGHAHVHFHVIARLPDWPDTLRGAKVFSANGSKAVNPLPSAVTPPLAERLRDYILAH
jgi:diadenosine tetraphosphate (Ap4A) HIT family hydrolase